MGFAYIIKGLVELITVHFLMQTAFDVSACNRKRYMVCSVLFLALMFSKGIIEYPVPYNSLLRIAALLMATVCYRTNLINRILTAMFTFVIMTCTQAIVFFLSGCMDCCPIVISKPEDSIWTWIVLGCSAVQLVMTLIVCKLIAMYRAYPQKTYASIFLIVFCLCMLAIELIVMLTDSIYMPSTFITLIFVLFCVGLCIGLFREQLRVQEERPRLEFLEKHTANQVAHYAAFYNHDRDIRKMRHDLKNFVIGAQSYLQQQEYEKLDDYFSQFLGSIQPTEFFDTGNPLLDAVVTAKHTDAPQISFDVSIPPLTNQIGIDAMDIAMLLATALDNAIEGCEGCQDPFIRVKMVQQGRTLSILVQNPTNHPIREKKNRLITQKADPAQHGYGIPGMQRIANKYQGHLNWSLQDGVFSLRVLMQDFESHRE